jgi:hypothetical protein
MDATAFFSHMIRCGNRMKMERQEKYRQEQQQTNQLGGTGYGRRRSHNVLNTQVCFLCKAPESDANPARLLKQGQGHNHKTSKILVNFSFDKPGR